ncbi:hypothetical protein OC25_25630 [Pedobacter kyungheensis]|uniref:DUF4369 domain-containing protein n=1 Tax=Pedobacter kyungheensis TaxID=1069985 RepID=A0A0C1FBC7_9SPHI|nr:hypothetical protein [Pedobacter kyungheensis]KIA89178.1 hypothetical protein OC25_25630 [Pedobacter kyungheensis]
MKILVFLGLLVTSTSLFAQQFAFEVKGHIQDTEKAKYAYLYSAGNKGLFLRVPLVNGTFKFKSNADLDGNLLRWGIIFVEARNNVTAAEVKKNLDTQTWLPGGTAKIKNIILEDIDLDITQGSQINYPEIVGGGIFNKQLKEITATGSAKKINSFEFIKKYPNSPVSVLELQGIANFLEVLSLAKFEQTFGGSPQKMYAMLSDRLKESKEGKAVKMKIEARKK